MENKYRKSIIRAAVIISLLTVLLSGFVSPERSNLLSFFSFLVFPAMIAALIISGFKLIKGKRSAIIYLFIFLSFYFLYGSRLFQVSFNKSTRKDDLRVLSFNVGGFKQSVNPNQLPEELEVFFDFLKKEHIDVICLQEFSFVTRNIRKDLIDLGYRDIMHDNPFDRRLVIRENFFVKSDFFDSEVITDGKSKVLGVRTKILTGSDTILLVNSHIQSFNVKSRHPFRQTSLKGTFQAIGDIIKNIRKHHSEQFTQIITISELAKITPKAIICGDFNSVPSTYNYTWLSRFFSNAFEIAGNGFGITYLGKTLFFLRIDHQFFKGSGLKCIEFREIDFGFSDHKATYGIYRID